MRTTVGHYPVWHCFTRMPAKAKDLTEALMTDRFPFMVHGEGSWVFDHQGRRYLNALASLWNVQVGMGRTEIVDAISQQLATLTYFPLFRAGHPLAAALARKLLRIAPEHFAVVFFTNGGSEAVETALKASRASWKNQGYPNKHKVIALQGANHGVTFAALTASDPSEHGLYQPVLPGFRHVPAPHPSLRPVEMLPTDWARHCTQALEDAIREEGPENVAAFILEPVQGVAGVVVPPAEYFQEVDRICRNYQVHLIFDEIATGFGRIGAMFACQRWHVRPDMLVVSKGLTSGYFPMGAVLFTAEIHDSFIDAGTVFNHGSTTAGHPAGCAAALANLAIIERERLVERAADLGARILDSLSPLREVSVVHDVRGVGLMIGVELSKVPGRFLPLTPEETQAVGRAFYEAGMLVYAMSSTVCLFPPLSLTDDETQFLIGVMIDVISTLRVSADGRLELAAAAARS